MYCFSRFAVSILLRGVGVGANGWLLGVGSAVLIDFGLSKSAKRVRKTPSGQRVLAPRQRLPRSRPRAREQDQRRLALRRRLPRSLHVVYM